MSGLKNTLKRAFSFAKGGKYATGAERQAKAEGVKAAAAEAEQLKLDEMFASGQIPDEDFLKRAARRRAAKRRGSRVDTILTDTLG